MMADQEGNIVPNSTVQKVAYKVFIYMKFGHLGKGTRIPVPDCVRQKIREKYPELDGMFQGSKPLPQPTGILVLVDVSKPGSKGFSSSLT